jgi:ABC-type multidrug transport system ATPase subunit
LTDEPFAALDIESADLVVKAMQEEKARGTGILLITHLLPENLDADRKLFKSKNLLCVRHAP